MVDMCVICLLFKRFARALKTSDFHVDGQNYV